MLILNRRDSQSIYIDGKRICVTVLGVDRNKQVRLGIDAPADVSIHREELMDRLPRPSLSLASKENDHAD